MNILKSRRELLAMLGVGTLFILCSSSTNAQAQSHSGKSGMQGKGKGGSSHTDGSHDEGHTDDEQEHDDSEHEDGKRGPKYRGGRDTANFPRGKDMSLEDRILRSDRHLSFF